MNGKCVRLTKGDFTKKNTYNITPLHVAKSFEGAGVRRLHLVDLDGANGNVLNNLGTLENVATHTSLIIDFGGGLKTKQELKTVFNAGAVMVNLGSTIIKNPALFSEWINEFGVEKFLPGADVLNNKIKINGWKEDTVVDIFTFVKNLLTQEVNTIFCTDISKDGMMQGPSIILYKKILECFPALHLIASGGISCYEDLVTLKEAGCSGAIIGKAFYEGKITMLQIEAFIKNS